VNRGRRVVDEADQLQIVSSWGRTINALREEHTCIPIRNRFWGYRLSGSVSFVEQVHDYETALVRTGYNPHVVRFHLHSVAHFGVWDSMTPASVASPAFGHRQ
jgi:hypothetical protein